MAVAPLGHGGMVGESAGAPSSSAPAPCGCHGGRRSAADERGGRRRRGYAGGRCPPPPSPPARPPSRAAEGPIGARGRDVHADGAAAGRRRPCGLAGGAGRPATGRGAPGHLAGACGGRMACRPGGSAIPAQAGMAPLGPREFGQRAGPSLSMDPRRVDSRGRFGARPGGWRGGRSSRKPELAPGAPWRPSGAPPPLRRAVARTLAAAVGAAAGRGVASGFGWPPSVPRAGALDGGDGVLAASPHASAEEAGSRRVDREGASIAASGAARVDRRAVRGDRGLRELA
eukprot:2415316-Pyramimonas_sp.AAC.1